MFKSNKSVRAPRTEIRDLDREVRPLSSTDLRLTSGGHRESIPMTTDYGGGGASDDVGGV